MDLKPKIRKILREHYGEFESYLEHKYEEVLTENLISGSTRVKEAWATYNQVVLELKNSIKNTLKLISDLSTIIHSICSISLLGSFVWYLLNVPMLL
jgi:hypothetical protein